MALLPAMQGFSPLVESPRLRMLTVFLFYIAQGIPLGFFYVAIPAYMAKSGASPAQIAAVVGMTALPWSLKLVNGFIIDRYTYLPMGRRRMWIVGAQSMIVLGCLLGLVLQPGGQDVFVLSCLAFAISLATTFQDVAIDSLVVDIMTEEEQAKAGGVMFGAQALGSNGQRQGATGKPSRNRKGAGGKLKRGAQERLLQPKLSAATGAGTRQKKQTFSAAR